MIQSQNARRLKAFAKKREVRGQQVAPTPAASVSREQMRTECLGKLTAAILEARNKDAKLRDTTVIEALRYECHEPGARISSSNRIHVAMESIREETRYETAIWRSAIKSILELVDEAGAMHRNSTQLLDLMDTVAN